MQQQKNIANNGISTNTKYTIKNKDSENQIQNKQEKVEASSNDSKSSEKIRSFKGKNLQEPKKYTLEEIYLFMGIGRYQWAVMAFCFIGMLLHNYKPICPKPDNYLNMCVLCLIPTSIV